MKAFARTLYVLSLTAFCVACSDLAVTPTGNPDAYHKVVDQFPVLESGMGRIFFFGRNSAFSFKPTISINGEKLDGPYGKNIFFFFDRPAGEYVMAVDGEAALQIDLGRGDKKYVAMDSGQPRDPEGGFIKNTYSLDWILILRLMPAQHAEAVMRDMRWKK